MEKTKILSGVLAGTALVASTGLTFAALAPVEASASESARAVNTARTECPQGDTCYVTSQVMDGAFSFSQNVLSSNSQIANVFNKASAALCAPACADSQEAANLAVGGKALTVAGQDNRITSTLATMEESEGETKTIMGCACSANLPGGGAMINAEVSGVSLESLGKMVGAL